MHPQQVISLTMSLLLHTHCGLDCAMHCICWVHSCVTQILVCSAWILAFGQLMVVIVYNRDAEERVFHADVNQPAYYGLVSNVVGRTPDLVIVPLAGVVFASPGKKLSEHGGLMKQDVNVALMVYAPNLATAGTVYNSTVCFSRCLLVLLEICAGAYSDF